MPGPTITVKILALAAAVDAVEPGEIGIGGVGRATASDEAALPESVKFVYEGVLGPWIVGKDVILHVISRVGDDGCSYQAMEHTGPSLQHLSQDSRFTLTNMAIEAGAKSGIIAPDDVTLAYVKARQEATGRHSHFDVYESDGAATY